MFGIKRPRKILSKETGKEIWKKANSTLTKESVKIVSGEGFADREQGILRDKEFLDTVKNFTQENKKLMIMCWDKDGLQGLRDNFIKSYSNEEREKIREAIEKKTSIIYLAPKRPKWHFAVIDGKYLYMQKKHKQGAPSSEKPWLYCENDFFGEPLKHNAIFDSWAAKCTLVTPDDIIIQRG